eukprot:5723822-Amphidinium_carterae.1
MARGGRPAWCASIGLWHRTPTNPDHLHAVCACMLGAESACGVDVDTPSLASARRSVTLNKLPSTCSGVAFHEGPAGGEVARDCHSQTKRYL